MNHTLATSQNNIAILSTVTATLTIPYQDKNITFTQSSSHNTNLSFKETPTTGATPVVTITQTQFKTSTVPPWPAISSFPLPSFAAIPFYTTTTFITSVTTSFNHDPHSTPLTLFPFDDTHSPWRQIFPALIVFALLGVLSALTCLLLCVFCVYRRYHSHKRQEEETANPTMESTLWNLPAHVDSDSVPQFVPIASSPLTLVPRAAIWKDPERRRGVNEMDLWEQKRQRRQSAQQPPAPPEHAHPWSLPAQENEDDDGSRSGSGDDKGKGRQWTDCTVDSADNSSDSYLDDGRDRPWQRYMQQQQQQQQQVHPVSDLARAITGAALDDDNENDDQNSTQTSSFGSVFHSRLDSMDVQTGIVKRPFSR